MPHLSLQITPTGPDSFLFYASLQPRVDVTVSPDYLRRYYSAPSPANGAPTNGAAAADGPAAADGAAADTPDSWHAVMQVAWAVPGWSHYRSRGLEMGAMGQGLDIFGTLPMSAESMDAVGALCHRVSCRDVLSLRPCTCAEACLHASSWPHPACTSALIPSPPPPSPPS